MSISREMHTFCDIDNRESIWIDITKVVCSEEANCRKIHVKSFKKNFRTQNKAVYIVWGYIFTYVYIYVYVLLKV